LLLLISSSCISTGIRIEQRESRSVFKLSQPGEGWVFRRDLDGSWRRMCWLPHKRRNDGIILACSGQQVAIGAQGGLMTILDFSDI
jgi:hypothetical protein